jgi:hypothetical protein
MQQFGSARQIPPKRPRRVAVFFSAPAFDDYPFDEDEYRTSYHQLAALVSEAGSQFAIVRDKNTYRGAGEFSQAWIAEDGSFKLQKEPWRADIIYNKCKNDIFAPPDARLINAPELERLCTDKWETYQRFPHLFPETLQVQNTQELLWAMQQLGTELIVTKPLGGEGGQGIVIGTAQEVAAGASVFPLLVQGFLDTADGIPGIAKGLHDLRIISIAGEPVLSYVREPKPGSFLANESQGGLLSEVSLSALPNEALELFRTVDRAMEQFTDRVYSVDMGRSKSGKWQLIELNSKPGLDPIGKYPGSQRFMEALTRLLLTA